MSVGKDLEIPIWQKKIDIRIFCFGLGRLKTLVLKKHFVCEMACFLRAGHILVAAVCKIKILPAIWQ